MDIDTLIERQEVLVENQKQLLSAMVSTLDLMKAEKLRQEIDQEIAFDEPNKTVEQEEDPRVQKHKIIALKNGYTPEDVEEVASIYRSYYESGSVSYGQNGSSSTSYDRLQRSLMDANEVAQMDKDSCIILPFASKPIIDKKYKPFHDPSYLKAKKYGPYTHPVEIFRDKNGNLHTVNHQEKFYFPDEGLQAKIRDDLKEGKSSGMLFELSEDEFCSLDLDDPKLNGPQGNLFLLQQLKKLEDDSATLKLQNAVNEKMNSVIYDTSDNTSSLEADEESAAETISVYDVRQSWDLSGNLEDVIRRYILELSEDEVSNITEAMNRHIPEKKIKDCLTLPPEKLCLMLQFYMKQAN